MKKFTNLETFNKEQSAGTAIRELFHLISVPKEFEKFSKEQKDLIRSRCAEYLNSWVFDWIINYCINEQINATMLKARDMKEIDAGRYSVYGVMNFKKVVMDLASAPKEKKEFDKYASI